MRIRASDAHETFRAKPSPPLSTLEREVKTLGWPSTPGVPTWGGDLFCGSRSQLFIAVEERDSLNASNWPAHAPAATPPRVGLRPERRGHASPNFTSRLAHQGHKIAPMTFPSNRYIGRLIESTSWRRVAAQYEHAALASHSLRMVHPQMQAAQPFRAIATSSLIDMTGGRCGSAGG
ncbi:hypothetical protein Purlil1_3205 [Purpureocillium lilacinum]|uniref:Uncharacterized protein n=1 Tax=Purpureocillium lilacinum TaxID=33203 RepID=A0ABR0C8J3_PURLI|nr:hypothetical protein Purlil1_3205 [Purpureocillium lilacinum]